MRYEENWAITPERIRDFFRQQPDITESDDTFHFHQCCIRLIPCDGQLMEKWQQTRTIVIMEGPEPETTEIHQRFLLRFLSAGG